MQQNNQMAEASQQQETLQGADGLLEGLNQQVETLKEKVQGMTGDRLPTHKPGDPVTIDLVGFLFRLLERFWLILIAATVGTVGAWFYAQRSVPTYSATAKLYIVSQTDSLIKLSDLQVGTALAKDYLEVFRAWEVHELVRQDLNLNYSYGALSSMIGVSNPTDTRILSISAVHPDPQMAANLANAYARAAKQYITSVMNCEEPTDFSIARVPTTPNNSRKSTTVLMGFLLGSMLMVGILFLQYILDDRPQTPEDILEYAGIPTLAILPAVSEAEVVRRKNPHQKTQQEKRS